MLDHTNKGTVLVEILYKRDNKGKVLEGILYKRDNKVRHPSCGGFTQHSSFVVHPTEDFPSSVPSV